MSHFLMAENTEQQVSIKFCQKVDETHSKHLETLKKACGNNSVSCVMVTEGHWAFSLHGREIS